MRERVDQLYKEIRQIHEQYQKEVPKKCRPWPESIQSRILELWKFGVSTHQISQETGLPQQTHYSWRQRLKKKDVGFLPVPIVQKRHRRSQFDLQLSQLESNEVKISNCDSCHLRWFTHWRCSRWPGGRSGSKDLWLMSLKFRLGHQFFIYEEYVDVRSGFNRLSMFVREKMGRNLLEGDLFLFLGKNRERMKALCFDGTS